MRFQGLAAIACLGFAVSTHAAEPPDCAAFTRSIDQGQRQLSKLRAEARAGGRSDVYVRIQNELALLQINTALLLRSSCPAPSKPISADAYSKAADACTIAALRRDPSSDACDTTKWSPD